MMGFILDKPEELCSNHYLLRIDIFKEVSHPGQFTNIRIGNYTDPLLRRPFSIHNHEKNVVEIIFKVVGKGTRLLRDYAKSGEVDIIAPLGNGFTIIEKGRALLIGGGIGNAPLYYLAKRLKIKNNKIHYLYGAKSVDNIYQKEKYYSIADNINIMTNDGSLGEKGFIADIVPEILKKETFDQIYICGPVIMMYKIINFLKDIEIPLEVLIENYFGCGIGLCFGCTIDTFDGLKRVCIDGPVFDGRIINWGSLPVL